MKKYKRQSRTSLFARIYTNEIRMIFTDAGAILIFFLAMFFYPVLYTIAYEKELVREVPIAVVDNDHSHASRLYSRWIDATEQVQVVSKPTSMLDAKQEFYDGKIKGVVQIPSSFERNIASNTSNVVVVYCDASYFLLYKQLLAGSTYANAAFSAHIEINRSMQEGKSLSQALDSQNPLSTNVHNLFNPAGGYAHFVIPPILFIILQQTLLVGIGMLGGTIREKKQFLKYVAFAHKPSSTALMIFAKASAYTTVYLINSVLCLGIMYEFYNLPDKADFFTIGLLLVPAFYAVSFLGMAISMIFKERIHAYLFLVFLSPVVVFISGLSWPSISLPLPMQFFSFLFPSTEMVPALLKLRVYGAGFQSVKHEFVILITQLFVYFVIAFGAYRIMILRFLKNIYAKQQSVNYKQ